MHDVIENTNDKHTWLSENVFYNVKKLKIKIVFRT